MADKYDDELLEGLTEDERAALEEDEDTDGVDEAVDEAAEAADETTGDDDTDEEEAGDDDADDSGEEEDGKAEEEAGTEGAGEEGDDADDEKADDKDEPEARERAPHPLLTADIPEDVEDKLKDIATTREELDTKFDDGDLTTKEYRQEMAKLDRSEREIEQAQFKAKIAQEMQQQQQQQAWLETVNDFLDTHTQYRDKPLLFNTLDMVVKQIANDEGNAELTGRQILNKAHSQIQDELGISQPADGDGGKPQAKDKGKGKKSKPEAPPTLGKVPAAEANDPTASSKFKRLDDLAERDPMAHEKAVEALSESEREAYFAAQ